MKRFALLLALSCSLALASTPQVQSLLEQAQSLAAQAQKTYVGAYPDDPLWGQAIQVAKRATELDPKDPAAWQLLAQLYTTTHWWYPARQAWLTYLQLVPNDPKAAAELEKVDIQLGYIAYERNHLAHAKMYFKEAAQYAPQDDVPLQWLGRIALEEGHPHRAQTYWAEAEKLNPSPQNAYFLAQSQEIATHGATAVKAFEEGYQAYTSGHYHQALQDFQTALQNSPNWVEAERWVGRTALKLNNPQQALQAWEAVVASPQATPGDRYFLQLSQLAVRHGLEAAQAFLDGVGSYSQGNYTQALSSFQLAVQKASDFAEAWYWLGRTEYKLGQYQLAALAYHTVLQLQPNNANAQYWYQQALKQAQTQ
jgi:tetratricopeptide (TPR) repeat protein